MSQKHPFRVLISNDTVLRRIRELASLIQADFAHQPALGVVVIDGARMFARHLQKHLSPAMEWHELRASSYGAGTTSTGVVQLGSQGDLDVRGRAVIIFEDIVDTGRTVAALRERFLSQGATEVRVATLLSKPARRVVEVPLHYTGFEIPDEFVIGFGMDFAGRYREIEEVVVYDESRATAFHSPI
ncbi:MAG: phosphoribosyltransferase family protein [Planctomycetota bacterium]